MLSAKLIHLLTNPVQPNLIPICITPRFSTSNTSHATLFTYCCPVTTGSAGSAMVANVDGRLTRVVQLTKGYSGSDLTAVCAEAGKSVSSLLRYASILVN